MDCQAVRELADRIEETAARIDRESARLLFGWLAVDQSEGAFCRIDLKGRDRARGAFRRIKILAVRREVDVGRPRLDARAFWHRADDLDFLLHHTLRGI